MMRQALLLSSIWYSRSDSITTSSGFFGGASRDSWYVGDTISLNL